MIKQLYEKITYIIPSYSFLPLISVVLMNTITYFGTRLITTGAYHYSLKIFVDDLIPLNEHFIYIYFIAYVQWILGFILIARESKDFCYQYLSGEIIAKFLCLLFFVFYPTTIARPEITGSGLSNTLTAWLYEMDAADNLFPSIHCLESYVCFRSALKMKKVSRLYLPVTTVFSLLVFASTVLLKQHVILDMVGAIIAVEIGLGFSSFFRQHGKRVRKDKVYE